MFKPVMFKEFLCRPGQVGSIIPSSRFLARKMTKDIQSNYSVIELGAGNGCVTKYIKKTGCENVFIYECNLNFMMLLKDSYHSLGYTFFSDAFDVDSNHVNNSVDVVVSSLPLFNFPYEMRYNLLAKVHKVIRDDGLLVMFTYRRHFPVSMYDLSSIGFDIVDLDKVWLNIPPATVFFLKK